MLDISKRLGLCLGIAASFCMTACGDDSGDKGDVEEIECSTNDECTDSAKPVCKDNVCVAEEPAGETGECSDDTDCKDETKPKCNKETKKCEAKGGEEPANECTDGKSECSGGCFDLKSDRENCGECGHICSSGEICKEGTCELEKTNTDECDDTEIPTCEGNTAKKCVNKKYVTEDCGDNKCDGGECKAESECDDSTPPSCEGNSAKVCEGGHFKTTDCADKACKDGECSNESFTKECDEDTQPTCDEEGQAKKCVNNKFEYQNCGTMTCVEGECKEVAECDPEVYEAECEGNGVKTCVEGKYKVDACGDGQVCKSGACASTALDDLCPGDEDKKGPGICGCGLPDSDINNDGTVDCIEKDAKGNTVDLCPDDPNKELPGICGCGIPDTVNESTGNPKCLESGLKDNDLCPDDPNKKMPGVCGCGFSDALNPLTRLPQCIGVDLVGNKFDNCPQDNNKLVAGTCGCGSADEIDEEKGIPKCLLISDEDDLCPDDPDKTRPGICGCGKPDSGDNLQDSDGDTVPDCIDQCKDNKYKYIEDACECSEVRVMLDNAEFCAIPITTAEEFVDLKTKGVDNKSYALMEDINLYDYYETTMINDWTGIFANFRGKFVSSGKKISFTKGSEHGKLKCSASPCGLFKSMTGARIDNIKLDLNIESTGANTGMLSGTMSGSNVSNVEVAGDVKGAGSYIGGLVGDASSSTTLSNIKHTGNVTNTVNYVGGIAGRLNGILSTANSSGNIEGVDYVGGIIGSATGAISNITLDGEVKCQNDCGGAIGYHSGALTNVESKVNVVSHNKACSRWHFIYVGGITGQLSGGTYKTIKNNGSLKRTSECKVNEIGVAGIIGFIRGTASLEDVHNHADLTITLSHSAGGVFGGTVYEKGVSMENVSNSGNITCTTEAGGCSYLGGIVGTWHSFADRNGSEETFEHKFNNIKNSGNIVTGGGTCGGIVGNLRARGQNASLIMTNILNTGKITSPSSNIGGLFGDFGCTRSKCTLTDAYNTGDIDSKSSSVGGLIGTINHNTPRWNSATDNSYKARSNRFEINRAYSTGNIKGTSSVGGIIGSAEINLLGRKAISGSGGNFTLTCSTNSATTFSSPTVYQWFDAEHVMVMSNIYSTGTITGTSSVGGLFGYINGNSQNATQTVKKYSYSTDGECTLNTETTTQTVKQGVKVTLANAFSAAEIVSSSSSFGGLIGNYNYANSLGNAYAHIFNNIYATGIVPTKGGALFGTVPANITYKNMYYWPNTTGAQTVSPSGTAPAGIVSFEYVSAVPHITEYDVDLLNQLNGNIKSSSSAELSKDISASWEQKDHNLSAKLPVKIPFLMVGPSEELLNVGVEKQNNDDNNNNNEDDRS